MMMLFFDYIKKIRFVILLFAVCVLIFAVSFILYHIPVQAVVYPTLLCLLCAVFFLAIGFSRYRKKHERLNTVKRLTAAMMDTLPEAEDIIDSDYAEIIENLRTELLQLDTESSARYSEMTDYYTVWAHQIKTPIASMKLKLQSEDSPLSRQLSSDLFRIEQYAEMVLAFLRLESTSSDYVFREHDIDGIIRQSVKKFASDFIGRKLKLEFIPTELKIITDEKWFSFVLEQILSNALKYTREGGIRIYAEEKKLYISDTGMGIAPEDLPRIFEKGYTGFNGRLDKSASGLGLYLCRRICKNLGIGISVDSVPDKGTCVCLDLEQYKTRKE